MDEDINVSGISENLAESILEQSATKEKKVGATILHGKRIAISVSESEELEQLGLSEHHVKDISIEMARYLLIAGSKMIYGGDLRIGGFTKLFAELSFQYKYLRDKEPSFINYFPFPNSKQLSVKDKADFVKQQVEAKVIEVPKHLGSIDVDKEYKPFENVEDRYIYSECFTAMRTAMAKESDARILIGGKQKNFLGYFPGIVEEAYHTIKEGKPIFLLGGFGGATHTLIQAITTNEAPNVLTNEVQFHSAFLKEFKDYCKGKSTIELDYKEITARVKQYDLKSISQKNGLSEDENQILFESRNIHELVFLVMKGLKNIK
jgi:hypothetical protein